ncbi:BQ2448_485 [Microbotryum intermedium]|uniref:BQ2448_485 protein n=1 Tax=Microbotryum intermedium TaxID=269621 RepID=A0A238F906_9BASI|nr:BQ2448_485 [Microbotryum intermedium]
MTKLTTAVPAGSGTLILTRSTHQARFSTVSFCYPLKLIVPKRHFVDGLQCVYIVGYGGGMVAGDRIELNVEVKDGSTLVMLTQGSTKIFRLRPGHYLTSPTSITSTTPTLQTLTTYLDSNSTLILLPSPVTCFACSSYSQTQSFHLSPDRTSSLVLLDWYTSGRSCMVSTSVNGDRSNLLDEESTEQWAFDRYQSMNLIHLGDRLIVKDVLLLEDETPGSTPNLNSQPENVHHLRPGPTTYKARLEPYSVYATLFLFGPRTQSLRNHISSIFSNLTQYPQAHPYSLIWSYTELEKGQGGIVRIAAVATEETKDWIKEVLRGGGIEELVGKDLWGNVFN